MNFDRSDHLARELSTLGTCWLAFRPAELVMALGHLPCWGISLCLFSPGREPLLYIPELEPGDRLPPHVTCRRFPWGDPTCPDPWKVLLAMIRDDVGREGLSGLSLAWRDRSAQAGHAQMCAESPPMDELLPALLAEQVFSGRMEDAGGVLDRLFVRKTAVEINQIRLANEVAAKGVSAFQAGLRPGMTEAQLAGEVEAAIMAEMGREDVFHARGWAMIQSGPETARGGTYSRTTGRMMGEGDPVFLELVTCVNGYYSDLTRVGMVGGAAGRWLEVLEAVRESQRLAIDAIEPGLPCSEVDRVARRSLERAGLAESFTHLTGHQVGFHYHDPGPVLGPGSSAILEPGMVVTVEPGVYLPEEGFGLRLEDNLLVSESGGRALSSVAPGGYVEERS